MKKKLLVSSLCLLSLATVATVLSTSSSFTEKLLGINAAGVCTTCEGNHYPSERYSTKEGEQGQGKSGVREYWVCCKCHKHYLSTSEIPGYDKAKWTDMKEKGETSGPTDSRTYFGGLTSIYNVPETTEAITVDGVKDDAYTNSYPFKWKGWGSQTEKDISANLSTAWKGSLLYLFVDVHDTTACVRDFANDPNTSISTTTHDSLEIYLDTKHSEQYTTTSWTGAWGGDYRKNTTAGSGKRTDYACEGHFKIAAGYDKTDRWGEGIGCEFDQWVWMSGICRSDNITTGKSKIKEDNKGYTFEYVINLNSAHICNSEIGIGFKYLDRLADGTHNYNLCFEDVNDSMAKTPRYCSNFKLVGFEAFDNNLV